MAVFKISNYISKYKPIAQRHAMARKHLHYMIARKGKNGEEMLRQLFSKDGDVDVAYALDLIENRRTHIFKIILNFDPKTEEDKRNLNLESLTKLLMIEIQERFGKDVAWVATIHDDHTDLRHIHSMVFTNGFFKRNDLKYFRDYVTQQALAQRHEREQRQERGLFARLQQQKPAKQILQSEERRVRGIQKPYCEACNNGYSLKPGERCPQCYRSRENNVELTL